VCRLEAVEIQDDALAKSVVHAAIADPERLHRLPQRVAHVAGGFAVGARLHAGKGGDDDVQRRMVGEVRQQELVEVDEGQLVDVAGAVSEG
jgi:hypothetical protein